MDTRDNKPQSQDDSNEKAGIIGKGLAHNADELGINEDVAGRDRTDEERNARSHHQLHGNRKYESFRNHSSADDQPTTDTGA